MPKFIDIKEAENHLGNLIDASNSGERYFIQKGNKIVAKLIVFKEGERIPGLSEGEVWVSDDFDDPLPDEFWFGREDENLI